MPQEHYLLPPRPCARVQDGKHAQEVAEFQAELAEARTQLQLLQKQLDEQLSKQPVENQEVTVGGSFASQSAGPPELAARAAVQALHARSAWKGRLFLLSTT